MQLKAGNLIMTYDRGFLRYIRLGKYEVLRMIYFALRDQNWDTIDGSLEDEKIHTGERSFSISYRWISSDVNFPFIWIVSIEGKDNSEIIFSIQGVAQQDILKNRTGFCILHPIAENAGGQCTIKHPDGKSSEGRFPRLISPHQPFFDIAGMKWPLGQKGHAYLEFSGDIFETEDQRNWTDDSYKTYCTPLRLPFPAILRKGEVVQQQVVLKVEEAGMEFDFRADELCVLQPKATIDLKPKIGTSAPDNGNPLQDKDLEYLRLLNLDHYRIELDFMAPNWKDQLDLKIKDARQLEVDVELWVKFSKLYSEEIILLTNYLDQLPVKTVRYLLILRRDYKVTPLFLIKAVGSRLRDLRQEILIGAGTTAYFTELNRDRVKPDDLDFISYSVNPQVHAFDDASLTENAQAQLYTVESSREYFPGKEIHISPVTLKPRFNPNATTPDTNQEEGLPDSVDFRQSELFGAGWTIASLKNLAESGANVITYYEATGMTGIIQGDREPAFPEDFPVRRNMLFPLYHILKCFLDHRDWEWITFSSSASLSLEAIGFRREHIVRVLLVNQLNVPVKGQIKYPSSQYKLFVFDDNHLADSYFDATYLTRNLEESSFVFGQVPELIIAKNAIVYIELHD